MSDLKEKFGKIVKKLRKKKGMTQEDLAHKTGISVDFLSLVERGKNAPSFETLEKLAGALEVKVRDFFIFESYEV